MQPKPTVRGALVLTALVTLQTVGASADDCRVSGPPREDRLLSVESRGELVFASGARATLSGLHWPDDEAMGREAQAWLLRLRDKPLTVWDRGDPDRWGRNHVDAVTTGEPPLDLAAGLISAGLAQVDAGEDDALCNPGLLALEDAPRKGRVGVWTTPVREARDGAALAAIEGDFVVVHGRVVHVGERSRRTYLNFAARGESGLSVTVTKRTWRIMQDRGLTASTLKGRFVRVRGRVEVWRGPILDIASADMIEVLEGEQAPRR